MILTYKTLPCNPPLTPNAFPKALIFPNTLAWHPISTCQGWPSEAYISHQPKDTVTPDSSQMNDEG